MACGLSAGYALPCKDKVGGIYKVWFANYDDATTNAGVTLTGNTVSAISASLDVYEFVVKGSNNLETTVNSSRENGTTYYEQVLSLTLTDLTQDYGAALQDLAKSLMVAFVQDNNGQTWCIGYQHGLDLTAGTAVTGTAMGDLYGYTITLTGQESIAPAYIASSDFASPFAAFTPVINS